MHPINDMKRQSLRSGFDKSLWIFSTAPRDENNIQRSKVQSLWNSRAVCPEIAIRNKDRVKIFLYFVSLQTLGIPRLEGWFPINFIFWPNELELELQYFTQLLILIPWVIVFTYRPQIMAKKTTRRTLRCVITSWHMLLLLIALCAMR